MSGPVLKKKSKDLAEKLGSPSFKATIGWFER